MLMSKPTRRFIKNSIGYVKSNYDPVDLLQRARTPEEAVQAREALIIHFTPLAIAIAGRYAYRFPAKDLDILSEAILALTADVAKIIADTTITGEFLAPRLHITIRGAIMNFVSKDAAIKNPADSKWFRAKVKASPEEDHYNANMASLDDPKCNVDQGYDSAYYDIYLRDLINHPALLPLERKVVSLCLDGYDDREIAKQLGYSATWVGKTRKDAGAMIKKIIAGGK